LELAILFAGSFMNSGKLSIMHTVSHTIRRWRYSSKYGLEGIDGIARPRRNTLLKRSDSVMIRLLFWWLG
jgi:hypothetical protein